MKTSLVLASVFLVGCAKEPSPTVAVPISPTPAVGRYALYEFQERIETWSEQMNEPRPAEDLNKLPVIVTQPVVYRLDTVTGKVDRLERARVTDAKGRIDNAEGWEPTLEERPMSQIERMSAVK